MAKKEDIPGPGMYNTIDLGSHGKYPISNVKNSMAITWNPPTSKRFPSELRHTFDNPHHSTYNPSDTDSMNPCTYILSKHRTLNAKKMVALTPHQQLMSKTMGPGGFISRTSKF